MDFYSDRSEGKAFPAVFVVDKMVLVTCFGIVLILRLYLYGNYLSSRESSLSLHDSLAKMPVMAWLATLFVWQHD